MNLQQMEYIVAVDKYRHFVRAAESCGVTQSTLSSLIHKLEAELDITIFDRNAHPVRPTEVGEEIIHQARIILYNISQVKELVSTRKDQSVGNIRLGIASTIAPYILPKIFKHLSQHHPDLHLHAEEARVAEIVQKIERAELDVALLAMPIDNPELLEIPIYTEQYVAYVSPLDKMYDTDQFATEQLSPDNIWVLRESYCPNKSIFPFCACETPNAAIYEAGTIETLVRIVDENGGYTIIPEMQIPLLSQTQLENVRRLHSPIPKREIALVVRKDFVRQRMLNILADAIKSIVPDEMINDRLKKYSIKL